MLTLGRRLTSESEMKLDRIETEVRWDQRWSRQSKCQVVKEGQGVKLNVRLDSKLDIQTEEYNLKY